MFLPFFRYPFSLENAKFTTRSCEFAYRKISIDRPGGIHFFSTHIFWIIHKRTKIKTYSERVETFLSEYAIIIVLWQVVRKLCLEKKWIPPGLSIEILRYNNKRGARKRIKVPKKQHLLSWWMQIEPFLYPYTYLPYHFFTVI